MRAVVLTLFAAGAAWAPLDFARSEQQNVSTSKPEDLSWVEKRVEEWQAKPSERKFDQIGWLTDIREALALGKKHNRPVFLFTHDGRMAIGRC